MNTGQHQKASRRKYVLIALTLAFLATIIGSSETLIWKVFPPIRLVFWFPLLIFVDRFKGYPDAVTEVFLSLVQFPLLAMFFIAGIRWMRPSMAIITIGAAYTFMVLAAWIILKTSN